VLTRAAIAALGSGLTGKLRKLAQPQRLSPHATTQAVPNTARMPTPKTRIQSMVKLGTVSIAALSGLSGWRTYFDFSSASFQPPPRATTRSTVVVRRLASTASSALWAASAVASAVTTVV
jgi:hypothetical protein